MTSIGRVIAVSVAAALLSGWVPGIASAQSAATRIEQLEANRAVDDLIAALKHGDSTVRVRAASALGRIGDLRAAGPLIAALKDADIWVRTHSAKALGG